MVMRTLCAVGGGWSAQPWPKERHRAADEVPSKLGGTQGTEESHKSHNSLHWEILGFVGRDIPVENLMSVNGVLLVAVSWEAMGGFAISNECKTSQMLSEVWMCCLGG